jgi:4,5-DOPA dioxygenase extradiol
MATRGKAQENKKSDRMPVLFVGHGSPMNAIEDNDFCRAWVEVARHLPRPRAILCVSAHWESDGTRVTAMPKPRTIHDFYGFPKELNTKQYPAPGSPELAETTRRTIRQTPVAPDLEWGLDHGTWAVLCRMFPQADVPVIQLSLDRRQPARAHYEIGRELAPLREQGVLIIGSGNMVHNLGLLEWSDEPFDWAVAFDAKLKDLILRRDHDALIQYEKLGPDSRKAVPTNEHYLPLLYALALQGKDERLSFFTEKVTLGSISMRGLRIG